MKRFTASRKISIDMAHRVPDHGSKCRNLHGHTYTVIATIGGALATYGEEKGMVMDFGFLKELMMSEIDAHYDHGLCLYVNDPVLSRLLGPEYAEIKERVEATGAAYLTDCDNVFGAGKLAVVTEVPTAENLAAIWFNALGPLVFVRSEQRAMLSNIRVWETPNCYADFGPML